MRKANWIITAILIVASVFFLWLWYFLQFNLIDDPLDLTLTICWWAIVIAGCIGIHITEQKRQERMRTTYLGQGVLFNPEAGLVNTTGAATQVDALQNVLENMKYSFDMKDFPNPDVLSLNYIVHTSKFKAATQSDSRPIWEGEVSFVHDPDKAPVPFKNRSELSRILGYMPAA